MKAIKCSTAYKFPLDKFNGEIELFIIERHDEERMENSEDGLSTLLDKVEGVSATDYNGHFGNSIFLTLEAEDDNTVTHDKIRNLINNYIAGMLPE